MLIAFIMQAVCVICFLTTALDGSASHAGFFPLRALKCVSMFIYILHSELVQCAIQSYFAEAETEEASGALLDSLAVYGLVTPPSSASLWLC